MYLSELLIDQTDLDFSDYNYWRVRGTDEPCDVLNDLGALVIAATLHMNKIEPEDNNFVFIRVPFNSWFQRANSVPLSANLESVLRR